MQVSSDRNTRDGNSRKFFAIRFGKFGCNIGDSMVGNVRYNDYQLETQTLRFKMGEKPVTLQGGLSLGRTGISLKAMIRNLRKEGGGYLVEFNFLASVEKEYLMGE